MIANFKEERKFLNKKLREKLIENFGSEDFPYISEEIAFKMAEEMEKMEFFKEWDIKVVRGHYNHPDYSVDDSPCNNCIDNVDDYIDYRMMNGEYSCEDCCCEKIRKHTYVKAYLNANLVIFDFTKYQFKEVLMSNWVEDYLLSRKSKEDLVDELIEFNKYVATDQKSYYPGKIIGIKG